MPARAIKLTAKKCTPCEGSVPKLSAAQAESLLAQIPGWALAQRATRLKRGMAFKDFVANMNFLNDVARLAEAEGHHPDFTVHYNRTEFDIWTHAIGGLSENDFILAAKIDRLARRHKAR